MISELKDDKLVCPCHGSVFDGRSGAVLEGPAVHPLQELNYEILDENTVSILTGN
jgi:Rieske Fe-S protein